MSLADPTKTHLNKDLTHDHPLVEQTSESQSELREAKVRHIELGLPLR